MAKIPKSVQNKNLAEEIGKKITNSSTWREPQKQKWDRFYKIYRSYLEKKNYPWQSNIFVPYAFSTVETIVPRLVSTKPQIDVMPREKSDTLYAQIQSQLVDYQWELMDMDSMLPDMIRQFLVYGTAIMKVGWDKQTRMIEKQTNIDPEFPDMGKKTEKVEEVIRDCPLVELVDLYDFFWDPNGYNIESCAWVAHRTYRSYDYLLAKQKQGIYKNVKMLKDDAGRMFEEHTDKNEREAATGASNPRSYGSGSTNEDGIEVIEYWENNRIVTLANRKVVIREEDENPNAHGKKPFIRVVDQSVPKEFLGIGVVEPIETLQYELNDMRNQRMDNASMILNRMWIVENGAGVDEDELVSDVGGVIHTSDINGIAPVLMPEIPNSSYREETLIKGDIQQTTGVTDFTKGIASDAMANQTATGISIMQESASSRMRLKMLNLETAIKEIGEFMVSLNKQFITEDKVIRITGDFGAEWMTIKPENLYDNFDVKVQSGSALEESDAIQRKQTLEMFQLFVGDPDVNQIELKKRVFESRNEKNIEKLFNLDTGGTVAGPQGGEQTSLSEIPGGAAGLPGNSDRNASGVMQSANELNRGVKETK